MLLTFEYEAKVSLCHKQNKTKQWVAQVEEAVQIRPRHSWITSPSSDIQLVNVSEKHRPRVKYRTGLWGSCQENLHSHSQQWRSNTHKTNHSLWSDMYQQILQVEVLISDMKRFNQVIFLRPPLPFSGPRRTQIVFCPVSGYDKQLEVKCHIRKKSRPKRQPASGEVTPPAPRHLKSQSPP